MRNYLISVFAIQTALLFCYAQEQKRDIADVYSLQVVRARLRLPAGISLSVLEKQLNRLGDGTAVALLKVLDQAELKDPEKIKRLLPLVRESFEAPQIIVVEEDRKPKVTLFFLRYLRDEVEATDVRNEISKVIEFPGDQDCVVEFLKTLQVLPPNTRFLTVDERFRYKKWP